MSHSLPLQFFWDTKTKRKGRSRFNLLLLEHGEYYLEDFSALYFPLSLTTSSISFNEIITDANKIQGRLKLCSRSLVFEPNDVRYPLMKFPYKGLPSHTPVSEWCMENRRHHHALSTSVTGFFTFNCMSYFEMKGNDKVGPYKVLDSPPSEHGYPFIIALVHADMHMFLLKVEQLRHVWGIGVKQGQIYFAPAQLNNIGDEGEGTKEYYDYKKILYVYKKQYLLCARGLEIVCGGGISVYFIFDTSTQRDQVYSVLARALDNFSYLMLINYTASRSLNDLTQYP
eukprot:gene31956-38639_t